MVMTSILGQADVNFDILIAKMPPVTFYDDYFVG